MATTTSTGEDEGRRGGRLGLPGVCFYFVLFQDANTACLDVIVFVTVYTYMNCSQTLGVYTSVTSAEWPLVWNVCLYISAFFSRFLFRFLVCACWSDGALRQFSRAQKEKKNKLRRRNYRVISGVEAMCVKENSISTLRIFWYVCRLFSAPHPRPPPHFPASHSWVTHFIVVKFV